MKGKYLIIVLAAVIVAASGVLILRPLLSGKCNSKTGIAQGSKQVPGKALAVKKTFAKNMGGLNVRALNSRNRPNVFNIKAFKSEGSGSGVYIKSFVSGKIQEFAPGVYDIILDTVPQKLFKGIKVAAGEETLKDLNSVTGSLNVKITDSKNKPATFPVSVYYSKTDIKVAAVTANRPLELLAGVYDVEIGTLPKITESAVTIDPGKEKLLNLGLLTGALIVKTEKRDVRQSVKIKKSNTGELLISTRVNRSVEIRPGIYNVEIDTTPPQISKDVRVEIGKEVVVEAVIQAPLQAKPGKK